MESETNGLDALAFWMRETETLVEAVKRGAKAFKKRYRRWPKLVVTHERFKGADPIQVAGLARKRHVQVHNSDTIEGIYKLIFYG